MRDGQQSLWATRMTTAMMLPVAERLQRSGVDCVDIISHAGFDSAVRFLKDNPWQRIRALRSILRTPATAGSASGKTAWGFRIAPDDILRLHVTLTVQNGVSRLRAMSGLMDLDTITDTLRLAKSLGAQTIAAFVYSISPVHTDELYEQRAREIIELADVDYIMIKDSGGLLTPERTSGLVQAIRRAAGDRKITLHSHCLTGMAPRVYMVGAESGVDELQCAIWPLAHGASQPPMQATIRNLREEGYGVHVDEAEIDAASKYLVEVARRSGFPVGNPVEYDHFHYKHQVPGGMLSNLRSQLAEADLLDRFREILEETVVVREELGWPTMVTPFSQLVVSQALLNVVSGRRYETVPDQVQHYVLGHYGKLLAPVSPDVLDKILTKVTSDVARDPAGLEPALPGLRTRYPGTPDEELFLRYMIPENAVEEMLKAQEATAVQWRDVGSRTGGVAQQLIELIAKAATLNDVGEIVIQKGSIGLRLKA